MSRLSRNPVFRFRFICLHVTVCDLLSCVELFPGLLGYPGFVFQQLWNNGEDVPHSIYEHYNLL